MGSGPTNWFSPIEAPIVQSLVFSTPSTTIHNAGGQAILVRTTQRALARRGYGVPVSGVLDARTQSALAAAFGHGWGDLPWSTMLARLTDEPAVRSPAPRVAMSDIGPFTGMGLWWAGGVLLGFFVLKPLFKRKR